ncbi:hypothetical protein NONO_c31430 [Nocardia nova SH22a]|uniref:DUF8020 domain-containing protein n=1 Tax=Nocardia nova SH22a TaxID=1415166 RepID=W5TF35_9NOCA|nr:hypothetical protein [Nocardia nova]AHH17930.1 hypothetical protein NONO_c31430 [Nocardia nova SH22a]
MKIRKTAVVAALVATIVGTAYGTAAAAPTPGDKPDTSTVSTDVLPGAHYRASIVDHSVVVTTDGGSLTTLGSQLQVLDAHGQMVAGVPLTYNRDGKDWPIAARATSAWPWASAR